MAFKVTYFDTLAMGGWNKWQRSHLSHHLLPNLVTNVHSNHIPVELLFDYMADNKIDALLHTGFAYLFYPVWEHNYDLDRLIQSGFIPGVAQFSVYLTPLYSGLSETLLYCNRIAEETYDIPSDGLYLRNCWPVKNGFFGVFSKSLSVYDCNDMQHYLDDNTSSFDQLAYLVDIDTQVS